MKSMMVTGFSAVAAAILSLMAANILSAAIAGRRVAVGGSRGVDRALRRVGNAGVEPDDGDVPADGLVQLVRDGPRVERRKTDCRGVLREVVREHGHLLLDVGFSGRPLEGDDHLVLGGRGIGTQLHGLPELVLEAFRDDGDIDCHRGGEDRHGNEQCGGRQQQPLSSERTHGDTSSRIFHPGHAPGAGSHDHDERRSRHPMSRLARLSFLTSVRTPFV